VKVGYFMLLFLSGFGIAAALVVPALAPVRWYLAIAAVMAPFWIAWEFYRRRKP